MIKRLFVCERPYPLYRTMIKCMNDLQINDILVSNHVDGMEKMYPVLKNDKIFRKVFYFDDALYKEFNSYGNEREFCKFPKGIFMLLKKLIMYIQLQKKAEKIVLPNGLDVNEYDEIYVNDAASTMMFYLCHKKIKFIWVEHAKNIFQYKLSMVYRICFRVMPILEKLGITYSLHGTSKWVQAIEVNNNCDLISLIRKKEVREVDIDKIIENMADKDKNYIFELYSKAYNVVLDRAKPFYIVLTAPLYSDGLVSSEEEQIKVYENLIQRKIGTHDNVLIKPHPRDTVSYAEVFPDVTVVEASMSAEVFNLAVRLRLEGVYGIRTTTVDAFTNAKHKESYGIDQISEFLIK